MKTIKKWLMDKEGVFVVITWWIILFAVFSILLGVNINSVVKNLEITKETSQVHIHDFIKSGDLVLHYNEKISSASARYDQENEKYFLQINKYSLYSSKTSESTVNFTGDATASATLKIDLEVIDEYSIYYNHTSNTAEISHLLTKTESVSDLKTTIKATPSGELHLLWNNEDTGVVYTSGMKIELNRKDDFLVINGETTNVYFYEDGDVSNIKYKETNGEYKKTIDYQLIVEYKLGSKSYTTVNVDDSSLTDVEKGIINDSVSYFTELIEDSIGISKNAFTLVIVSSIVDVVLLAFGIVGIILLRRSKEE